MENPADSVGDVVAAAHHHGHVQRLFLLLAADAEPVRLDHVIADAVVAAQRRGDGEIAGAGDGKAETLLPVMQAAGMLLTEGRLKAVAEALQNLPIPKVMP